MGGVESFVHRIGRTGRAGKTGRAYTFFTEKDVGSLELTRLLRDAGQDVPQALNDLAATEADRNWKASYKKKGKGKGWGKGKGKGKGKGNSKGKGKGKGYSR